MRIIAGRFRSRGLKAVPGRKVRPTPDRLRETLFNILASDIEDAVFLDAYAGTGAVGLEALSRGARQCIFIEADARALVVLRENIRSLEVASASLAIRGRAARTVADYACDIAFVDPPYDSETEYALCLAALNCPLAIAQHASQVRLKNGYGALVKSRELKQGSNALTFFRRAERSNP